MTDLHSRLLAELMKPARYVAIKENFIWSVLDRDAAALSDESWPGEMGEDAISFAAKRNASHRLASILRMIAGDLLAKSSDLVADGQNDAGYGAQQAAAALLSILPPEEK